MTRRKAEPRTSLSMMYAGSLSTKPRMSRASSLLARTVLLKTVDERGFVFYTNYESRKGRELTENPNAALTFFWPELERQVCIAGAVKKLPTAESEKYFKSRPRGSQIGAWASQQSTIISGRSDIEDADKALEKKYAGQQVPIPPHWGGYRVSPESVEFWQGRRSRLHDRLRYRREKDAWIVERLSP